MLPSIPTSLAALSRPVKLLRKGLWRYAIALPFSCSSSKSFPSRGNTSTQPPFIHSYRNTYWLCLLSFWCVVSFNPSSSGQPKAVYFGVVLARSKRQPFAPTRWPNMQWVAQVAPDTQPDCALANMLMLLYSFLGTPLQGLEINATRLSDW